MQKKKIYFIIASKVISLPCLHHLSVVPQRERERERERDYHMLRGEGGERRGRGGGGGEMCIRAIAVNKVGE